MLPYPRDFELHSTIIVLAVTLLIVNNFGSTTSVPNIDTEYPIVITDEFNTEGPTYFGASVVLLEATSPLGHHGSSKGWVLIGAPKANSTHKEHQGIKEPGVIWRCSLGRTPAGLNHCSVVILDPKGNYLPKNPYYSLWDRKDNGGLGGSMHIGKSSKFVACASRWANQRYMVEGTNVTVLHTNGLCYNVPKRILQAEVTDESWPWNGTSYSDRLMPLLKTALDRNQLAKRSKSWADGMAGFALHLTERDELLLGAPGIEFYKGSVVQYLPNRTDALYYLRDRENIPPQVDKDSVEYMGYAVTSGHFFSTSNKTQFAAGSPRWGLITGRVYIFTLNTTAGKGLNQLDFIHEPLPGVSSSEPSADSFFGSYFGSSLCAADLDGDGLDELLVGAPWFTVVRNKSSGIFSSPTERSHELFAGVEQGCVFIYRSNGTHFEDTPMKIWGDAEPGARFGYAMSNLGDIDDDDFEDVAVSAPYENGGRGAVYIYRGSAKGPTWSQKLTPEKISATIRGFGYSLSGGVDIDGNLYSDLAVGSPASQTVVIYRTIPLVEVKGEVKFNPTRLRADLRDFNVSACISYKGKRVPESLPFRVELILDENRRVDDLVRWDDHEKSYGSNVSNLSITAKRIRFSAAFYQGGNHCYNFTAVKIREPETGDNETVLVEQNFLLDTLPSSDQPLPIIYNIQSSMESSRAAPTLNLTGSQADFGDLDKKMPMWKTRDGVAVYGHLPLSQECHSEGVECIADLRLTVNRVDSSENSSYLVGSTEVLTVEVTLVNMGDVANLPLRLNMSWDERLAVPPQPSQVCESFLGRKSGIMSCSLRKPLCRGERETLNISLTMTTLYSGEGGDTLSLNFSANSASGSTPASVRYSLPLRYQYSIHFYGSHMVDKQQLQLDSPQLKFAHDYKVDNEGPSPLYALQLEFEVPFALNTSLGVYRFLNLLSYQGRYKKSQVSCEIANGTELHSLITEDKNIEDGTFDVRRMNWSRIFPWKMSRADQEARTRNITCDTPEVLCATISCTPMHHFTVSDVSNFVLEMSFVRENFRIFEDFRVLAIQTESRARAMDDEGNSKLIEDGRGVYITVFQVEVSNMLPAWSIIVAVTGGLTLLILSVCMLHKCGFFKRGRRDDMRQLMAENTEGFVNQPQWKR